MSLSTSLRNLSARTIRGEILLILGIEAATRVAGAAVISDEKILAEISQEAKLTHSETLLPQIRQVLKIAGVERVDAVAVSSGPGSFTGLRIGLATAKALAYAWRIKIIGVPTLLAMAANFPAAVTVLPMLDAQKNRAYVQAFKSAAPVSKIEVRPVDEIVESAAALDAEVFLCGDVLGKIKIPLPPNVKLAPINLRMPRAVNVALCGKFLLEAGEVSNVMNLEPLYVRRSEAEELWERRHSLSAK